MEWGACTPPADHTECASLDVPIDYADDADGSMAVTLMRIRAEIPATTQLWYFAGGPGGSGPTVLPLLHQRFGETLRGVDLYTIAHRGTQGAARLSCPDQEAPGSPGGIGIRPDEGDACVAHISKTQSITLPHLTVSNAARDVQRAITANRGDAKVLVWGNSYGTYWAHRLVQLFPEAVDGLFLEALVPPGASYRNFDHWMNDAGERLMKRCADQPSCAALFDRDPLEVARELAGRLEAGHCAELGFPVRVSWLLGSFLYDHDLRGMLPMMLAMLERCDADDVRRLQHLYAATFADRGMLTAGDFSAPYYAHAVLSELWGGAPPSGTPLEEVAARCLFCPGDRHEIDAARARWPTYPTDPLDDAVAQYEGPMWMLQGGLDPAIPPDVAQSMRTYFDAARQHYIAFPDGAHTLTGKTPTDDGDCAMHLLGAFIEDPTQPPPTECVTKVQPPQLPSGPPGLADALLGK